MDKLKERIKEVVDREAAAAAGPAPAPPAEDVVAWPKQAKELVDERGSYGTGRSRRLSQPSFPKERRT